MSLAVMVYALNKVSLKATQRAYVKLNAQQTRNLGGNESEGGFWRLVSSLWYAVRLNAECPLVQVVGIQDGL